MRRLWWAVLIAGCGRVGFADLSTLSSGDGGSNAPTDGSGAIGACNSPGILFCDGFEAGLGAWPTGYGTVNLDHSLVHADGTSLVVSTDGATFGAAGVHPYSAIAAGSIHYRGWFYAPSGPALTKINLLGTDGNGANQGIVFLVDHEELRVYSAPGGGNTVTSGVTLPRDRWFCVEVHVDISAAAGAVRFDLDGTQIGATTGIPTLPGTGYVALAVGLLFTSGQAPITMYFDDVATGTQPLGCS